MEDTQPSETSLLVSQTRKIRNMVMVVVGLVLLGGVGVSGYYLGTQKVENTTSSQMVVVSPSPTPIPQLELPPLTTPLPGVEGTSIRPVTHSGWRTFKDYQRSIQLDYPPHLLVIPDKEKTILINPNTLNPENNLPFILLEITKEFAPPTYDSIEKPEEDVTNDLAPVTILGTTYPFSRYVMGEGSMCGGGSIYSYPIRLSDFNIFIYRQETYKFCDDNGKLLKDNQKKEIKTKQTDLDYARQILETIKPL